VRAREHLFLRSPLSFFITNTETRLPAFFFFVLMSSVLIAPSATRMCLQCGVCLYVYKGAKISATLLDTNEKEKDREGERVRACGRNSDSDAE